MIIHKALHNLGLTWNYRGYWQLYTAVQLVCEEPTRLESIGKEVYAAVAEECGCSVCCVERNIRTLIFKAWNGRRHILCEMANKILYSPPTVAEFVDMIVLDIMSKTTMQ